ncbi:methionine--tRNA ligase [Candidatus Uhrbacteria bacterium]|nr:methionine--tRNA ligase [Candidatus Uhrbacteria bacterium]
MSRFYLTTTLPYVNADPHIGFALEIVQADVVARLHRQKGEEVIFNTGTDEHGQKIYQKALEQGKEPQAYCNEYAAKFDRLKTALNLSYTHFIRTTSPDHVAAAQEFWRRCDAHGDIYKKNYQTKYCVGCELEKQDSELTDGRCPVHPNLALELREEENYFFRFSNYQKPLLDLYTAHPDFVVPDYRLTEIKNFVEAGLQDFSISRLKEKMPWGVSVPGDEAHVMYVWFDALINYISTLGWPKEGSDFETFWPGVQVAGKDNLRQQSAMWQAMLLSAGLPPSEQIFIHGFITADGAKMSKSLGNVVDPFAMVERYGTDALRYYLLREIVYGADGDFSLSRFDERYNGDLADELGNLLHRVLTMTEKYAEGIAPAPSAQGKQVSVDRAYFEELTDQYRFSEALSLVWDVVRIANQDIENAKPWAMAKEGRFDEVKDELAHLLHLLRQIADMLASYLPETAERMKRALAEPGKPIMKGEPLFPKMETL